MFSWLSVPSTTPARLPPPPPSYSDNPSPSDNAPYSRSAQKVFPLDLPCINMLRGKRVILASASPRRKQLLAQIGLTKIEVIPSDFPEDLDKSYFSAFEYVAETATQKCMSVFKQEIESDVEPSIIIAADTIIVSHFGAIIEKPLSFADHFAMLKSLRDSEPHKVCTSITVMSPTEDGLAPGYHMESHTEETIVKFDKQVTDELIESYVKTGEGRDKAGGYAIQGLGAILIESIEGSYDNVVGLPLRGLLRCIEAVMIPDKDHEEDLEE